MVQIWPGRFVCKQVTVCPGHIWTTLYFQSSCHKHLRALLSKNWPSLFWQQKTKKIWRHDQVLKQDITQHKCAPQFDSKTARIFQQFGFQFQSVKLFASWKVVQMMRGVTKIPGKLTTRGGVWGVKELEITLWQEAGDKRQLALTLLNILWSQSPAFNM